MNGCGDTPDLVVSSEVKSLEVLASIAGVIPKGTGYISTFTEHT